jgi:hypothetical protein
MPKGFLSKIKYYRGDSQYRTSIYLYLLRGIISTAELNG